MSDAKHGLIHRLYHGETTFPLIHERKKFYAVSLILVIIALGSMVFQGFNLGVEFKGGDILTVSAPGGAHVTESRKYVESFGIKDPIVQEVKSSKGATKLRVETAPLKAEVRTNLENGLAKRFNVDPNSIDSSSVDASWGSRVTKKALQGLVAFLIAVIIYISVRFEPKMAAAAIIALIHDLVLAAGVYSITGFVVTPSTVIALLTVLGYSLYDTIVVFDKVEENTRGLEKQTQQTYAEAAELAVNQTFMRSINTSMIALLPVSGLLFVGALLLGAGTLKDLALALFVGLASGAYSSLFLATPLLADLKEREPRFKALHARVIDRRTKGGAAPVRLSQRSANVGAEVPAEVVAAAPVRTAGTGASKSKKKGGRPGGRPGGAKKRR